MLCRKNNAKVRIFLLLLISSLLVPCFHVAAKQTSVKIIYSKKVENFGEYGDKLIAVQDQNSGLWGYMDKYGTYKIKPKYYNAYGFSGNLAAVQNADGKYIFINKSGKKAFTGSFDEIYPRLKGQNHCFLSGYAHVRVGNECYLIDKNGKQVGESYPDTSEEFALRNNATLYGDFMLSVSNGVSTVIDAKYNKIATIGTLYGSYYLEKDSYKLYDKDFEFVIDIKELADKNSLNLDFSVSNSGFIIFKKTVNGITTNCMYDLKGKKVIGFKYKSILPINNKYFIVKNNAGNSGIMNLSGKLVVPTDYSSSDLVEDLVHGGNSAILVKGNSSYSFNVSTGKLQKMKTLLHSAQYKSENCYYREDRPKLEVFSADGIPMNLYITLILSDVNLRSMAKDEVFIAQKTQNNKDRYLTYLK